MAIYLDNNHPGYEFLKKQNRQVNSVQSGELPENLLHVGILNIMPNADDYEKNLLLSLEGTGCDICPVWVRLDSHSYKSTPESHMKTFYRSFEQSFSESNFDLMILTGAPVELFNVSEIRYWPELREILLFAETNIKNTLGICWGGIAIGEILGITKTNFNRKLFGVFRNSYLNRLGDDEFFCPQSRHAGYLDDDVEAVIQAGNAVPLAYSREAGYFVFENPEGTLTAHLGHPEYNKERIVKEALRDRELGRDDVPPPSNFSIEQPTNTWHPHRKTFFNYWIQKASS